jgi:bifunctional DNA-binding transcriptional regulator/antitoxin component of YhaV-PrlF toxin-antitoxin module
LVQATFTINSRGVITLAVKLRQSMGLQTDDQLIAETTPQGSPLWPADTLRPEIYSLSRVEEFDKIEVELAVVLGPLQFGHGLQYAFFWMRTPFSQPQNL